MFTYALDRRLAALIRAAGLALIVSSLLNASHHRPGGDGRGLVISVMLTGSVVFWLAWMARAGRERPLTPELYGLAVTGGVLCGASPGSAAGAYVFVAVVAAGLRAELPRALPVALLGTLALGVSVLIYSGKGIGLVAYTLGFAASLLAASNSRQSVVRAEQAELLLAHSQRSHEEQLRAARLEESTRIARDIHDVLAHALAGLSIQLEATGALLERGADREQVLERIRRAHALAREGMRETRRAVGALRGELPAPVDIEALVADYRASGSEPVALTIEGDARRLCGPTGETVLRVTQEALTNVRKHAPGAEVAVVLHAGEGEQEEVRLLIVDHARAAVPSELAQAGGGYGLRGMRERAQLLGGSFEAGALEDGWRVELRLPPPPAAGQPA